MGECDIRIDIRIDAGRWQDGDADLVRTVETAARAALAAARDGGPAELSVLLTDDAAIAELNARWRGRDGPTNVLSFPGDDQSDDRMAGGRPEMLGDVVVAFETLAREADASAVPLPHHLGHLIVHGVLHLLGYDHESDADAAEMERREIGILAALGVPDPYRAEETMEERPLS